MKFLLPFVLLVILVNTIWRHYKWREKNRYRKEDDVIANFRRQKALKEIEDADDPPATIIKAVVD